MLKEQTWALIVTSIDDTEATWLDQLGIVVEDLGEVVDHDFLVLNTYTEPQELMLRLRYGAEKLIRLASGQID
jgi:hypothetical protein